jgi:branched-chain amino acid transport system ATP-binding protein
MLEVKKINVFYGNMQVLWDLSFDVEKGGITSLVGPNGAGKTTTLKTIMGLIHTASGSIKFLDKPLGKLPPFRIAKMGISLVPEGRQLFDGMTVYENLLMGAYLRSVNEAKDSLQRIFQLFPVLKERRGQSAGTLSGGEQQMLAIARALMMKPSLLMLDEPSFGLAPKLVVETFDTLRKLNEEEKITILLVEQNIHVALEISDEAYVLEEGKVIQKGTGRELLKEEYIKRAYLGI